MLSFADDLDYWSTSVNVNFYENYFEGYTRSSDNQYLEDLKDFGIVVRKDQMVKMRHKNIFYLTTTKTKPSFLTETHFLTLFRFFRDDVKNVSLITLVT